MKKIALILLLLIVVAITFAQDDAIKQYIETYREVAIKEMMRTGVPAAITLAQGIVESKAGQSDLVKASNNHFGIKCKTEWTGDRVYHDDDQKNECFRVYQSAEESFRDHSDFLKNRPYYTDLFYLDPADYKAWAKGLKKDGYATERNYPEMLCKMIEDYGLQQYSLLALERIKNGEQPEYANNNTDTRNNNAQTTVQETGKGSAVLVANDKPAELNNEKDASNGNNAVAAVNTEISSTAYPDGVFTINETHVIYAKAGTSLLALASNYNIGYKTLLNFNELDKADILDRDMLIYLEKKPKKGCRDYHIVASEETIEDIAQKEGVRLESLLQYNLLHRGLQPAAGQKIYLRGASGSAPKLQRGQMS